MEIVYTILMITIWYEHKTWIIVLLSLYTVLPFAALCAYASLLSFHTGILFQSILFIIYRNYNI